MIPEMLGLKLDSPARRYIILHATWIRRHAFKTDILGDWIMHYYMAFYTLFGLAMHIM